jgi:hypothetical protein
MPYRAPYRDVVGLWLDLQNAHLYGVPFALNWTQVK